MATKLTRHRHIMSAYLCHKLLKCSAAMSEDQWEWAAAAAVNPLISSGSSHRRLCGTFGPILAAEYQYTWRLACLLCFRIQNGVRFGSLLHGASLFWMIELVFIGETVVLSLLLSCLCYFFLSTTREKHHVCCQNVFSEPVKPLSTQSSLVMNYWAPEGECPWGGVVNLNITK